MDMSTVTSELDRRTSFASTRRWSYGSNGSAQNDWYRYHCHGDLKAQSDHLFSPLDCTFDAISLSTIADLGYPTSPETMTESAIEFDEDDHAEVARTPVTRQAMTQVSKALDLASAADYSLGSPLLEFYMPAFFEFSDQTNRRALVDHFCNSLSHLIVFREERGNPFQELVLPLTTRSSPVMNAIYALASAHMEYRGVENKEQSLYFHGEAIQGLAALIDQKGRTAENRNELLAAIMLLVYYEVVREAPDLPYTHARCIVADSSDIAGAEGAVQSRGRASQRRDDDHELISNSYRPHWDLPGARIPVL